MFSKARDRNHDPFHGRTHERVHDPFHGQAHNQFHDRTHDQVHDRPGRRIALGGILTAAIQCCLLAAVFLPTGKLALLSLSSMILSAAVVEYGAFYALVIYAASSLLSLIILPDKLICIPFIAFFGYYGILKAQIERIRLLWAEWLLKLAVFNVVAAAGRRMASSVFALFGNLPNAMWLTLIVLNVIFVIFDYAYSLAAGLYEQRVRPIPRK
jgi:hypothetical protein